ALHDAIDLLVAVLTDVGDVELAGVEAHSPGVAKAPGVVFVQSVLADERVVVGDRVGLVALPAVDIDAQDRSAEVLGDVLAVTAAIALVPVARVAGPRIPRTAAVAVGSIEIAVGSERDRAAVVDFAGFVDFKQHSLGVGARARPVLVRLELREDLRVRELVGCVVGGRGAVAHVEAPVLLVVGMWRESEEATLAGDLGEAIAQIEKRLVAQLIA